MCTEFCIALAIIMNNCIIKKAAGVKTSHIHLQPEAPHLKGTSDFIRAVRLTLTNPSTSVQLNIQVYGSCREDTVRFELHLTSSEPKVRYSTTLM